ncbi:hypothetical protein H0261_02905 [Pectobacterium versatile]|uniref:hypothetical protein n=1 Tax=Pectobacterium versatile TaxID=2488639 RepID=UPI000D19FE9B|nr:hypothetical protein [Pectobacterium versatile]AVT58535.1 hypothetical protein OA04_19630 [Pectobacterium versatile]MBA0182680.1 hypothetical protein [Pectobacterium versatile]
MTTTVYDRVNKLIATDSRWSRKLDELGYLGHIAFVDDTGFGKMVVRDDHVLTLAGNGQLIEHWKQWWSGDLSSPRPPILINGQEAITLHIVKMSTNTIIFDIGDVLAAHNVDDDGNKVINAVFAGTGSHHAGGVWLKTGCARSAIEAAKIGDICTGGEVRYVDFNSGMKNLECEKHLISDVANALLEKGMIMDTNNPLSQPVPITEQEVAHIRKLIANGDITPCAPTGGRTINWDARAISRLDAAIESIRQDEALAK